MREPAEPQGFIKLTGVGIPRLQAGEDVNQYDGPLFFFIVCSLY